MKTCPKCIKGIIMKQISIGEFIPEECECMVSHWFEGLKH